MALVGVVIVPPFNAVHNPVPGDGLLAAMVTNVPEHTLWSIPAFATIKFETIIFTVSFVIQAPFVIVQINKLFPTTKLLAVLVAEVGVVIIAVPVVVHNPVPGDGLLPFNVAVVTLHSC